LHPLPAHYPLARAKPNCIARIYGLANAAHVKYSDRLLDIDGILLLDKPLGLSSAGAVARVKRLFGARKAGHTGSLDPLASGMLPICFGEATKFGAQLLDADKTYRVTVRLGERTASADRESEVIEKRELPDFSAAQMQQALGEFPREYAQVPPMHSAIKQDGRPLYEYARAGITRERAARAIVIRDMAFLDWQPPDLTFDVRCSKGAYIRVLAEDLAAQLGTVAHLAGLRRLAVTPFSAEPQWTFEALEAMTAPQRLGLLLPVDAALKDWRRLDLPPGGVNAFRQGQTVSIAPEIPGNVRIYAAGVGFLGLGAIEPAGRVVPVRLVSSAKHSA
jgi:tRNA pseudouridine55 synthase